MSRAASPSPWLPEPMAAAPALDPLAIPSPRRKRYALLINPFYRKDPHASFGKHVLTPTLALTAIAGATPDNWQLGYWDENLLQGPPPLEPFPEVVAITVHLTFAKRAYELARWYRQWGAKVILGGLHVLSNPDEAAPHADAIALGEGVQLWPQILRDVEAGLVRAGLDVFADEPGPGKGSWDSPLARHPKVVATHHIGASTVQAQRAIAAGVTEIVDAFMSGEARHCVNLDPDRLGSVTLTVRHLDQVGVLAQVLDRLSAAHLNVEHMVNRVFRGGEAAVAFIDVEGEPSEELLDAVREIPHVLGVSVVMLSESSGRRS